MPLSVPPYSPEVNSVELLVRQFCARLSTRIFVGLRELETAIAAVLQEFWQEPARLHQMTGFGCCFDGVQRIQPSAAGKRMKRLSRPAGAEAWEAPASASCSPATGGRSAARPTPSIPCS